ncbi:unnamed protein product [Enterobius vermicularis]|uniref:Transmembrane protein n=1 Tax=Enterobius vermicularis TaxID=51028 RepID=A0A0N4V056_ENTVE|nr:unnamed protein product [Enterobius vermicularis]
MTEEAVEGDVKNVLVYERRKDVFYPWLCTATLLEFVYVKQPVVVDGNLNCCVIGGFIVGVIHVFVKIVSMAILVQEWLKVDAKNFSGQFNQQFYRMALATCVKIV